ncbi:MAG: phosphatidylserine decarboxylase [Lachnospiraceae bacterium]|nr:phosphatidylserine decarboxylase [Lachnospiraceae bacterium]
MKCLDRNGNLVNENSKQNYVLDKLYNTYIGRFILSGLTKPIISKVGGAVLSSAFSRIFISSFIKNNNIDMSIYETKKYNSYNDFFTRKIKKEARPIDYSEEVFISPCDSKLTVYDISKDSVVSIKNTRYTVNDLLKNGKLARRYKDGKMLVFRLCVDDYHRYCYVDDGYKSDNKIINGVLHTVNPLANDIYPIYKENSREYSLLKSRNFGTILMMEVGALMVGKICNHHGERFVCKGQEKGYFEFGGSTVVLLIQKNAVDIDKDILDNSKNNIETVVKFGEKIGIKKI